MSDERECSVCPSSVECCAHFEGQVVGMVQRESWKVYNATFRAQHGARCAECRSVPGWPYRHPIVVSGPALVTGKCATCGRLRVANKSNPQPHWTLEDATTDFEDRCAQMLEATP